MPHTLVALAQLLVLTQRDQQEGDQHCDWSAGALSASTYSRYT